MSSTATTAEFSRIAPNVKLRKGVKIFGFVNLYGCEIGDGTKIGPFVEIQKNAKISNTVRSRAIHSFKTQRVRVVLRQMR